MESNGRKSIRQQLANGAVIDALRIGSKAGRSRIHKLLGNPRCLRREMGKSCSCRPKEIVVEDVAPPHYARTGLK